ncbi:hypothetical protein [Thiosocius teredinicola]|uniref:hypothetical protein n=1 Tax=Thiosocius teredinicola TaxID=1973002 RepID=UPI000990BD6E
MSDDSKRLLMELERTMRSINREVINPEIPELTLDDLRPVLCLVANARARYLKALIALGNDAEDGQASTDQLKQLARLRLEYDELVNGARALETAIQRGYLDVNTNTA